AGVRAVRRAAPEAGIDADGQLAPSKCLPEALGLVERAGVVAYAARDEVLEMARGHLRGELDGVGRHADAQRALHLVIAGRVHVQPEAPENSQDSGARVRLHGVPQREAEGRREGEGGPRSVLEALAVVDVARRPEAIADLCGLARREEHRGSICGEGAPFATQRAFLFLTAGAPGAYEKPCVAGSSSSLV